MFDSFDVFFVFQIKDSGLGEDEQKEDLETQAEDNIIGKMFIYLWLICINPNPRNTSCSPPAVPANKSYTVAILKPDAVAHGKVTEIIMKVGRG